MKNLGMLKVTGGIVLTVAVLLAVGRAYTNDPSPRFRLLGRELLETPNNAAPAKVFVYQDRATGDEIICFSGELRETLSCLKTGRMRGTN